MKLILALLIILVLLYSQFDYQNEKVVKFTTGKTAISQWDISVKKIESIKRNIGIINNINSVNVIIDELLYDTKTNRRIDFFSSTKHKTLFNWAWSSEDCGEWRANETKLTHWNFHMGHTWLHLIPKDSVVLDIGTQAGDTTLVFANKARRVVGIEASNALFKKALINSLINPHLNIELYNYAAWVENTTLKFRYVNPDLACNGGLNDVSGTNFVDVEAIDIAEFIKNRGPFDIIKIDTESQDIKILNHIIKNKSVRTGQIFIIEFFVKFCEKFSIFKEKWMELNGIGCTILWEEMYKFTNVQRPDSEYKNWKQSCESMSDLLIRC